MEGNAYNLITFQTDAYTENAKLTVIPSPDSMLRVFMAWKPLDALIMLRVFIAWKPLDALIEIEPLELPAFARNGFIVVEWGGTELK